MPPWLFADVYVFSNFWNGCRVNCRIFSGEGAAAAPYLFGRRIAVLAEKNVNRPQQAPKTCERSHSAAEGIHRHHRGFDRSCTRSISIPRRAAMTLSAEEQLKKVDQEAHICETCGVQYAPSVSAPAECKICTDDRQFVPKGGPRWLTQGGMKNSGLYQNMWQKVEPGLYALSTNPRFAIGQRTFLVRTPHGNLLWDCISFLDDATIDLVKALGGLRGIAISHPHFYATNAQWSAAFGNVPVYIHKRDAQWVTFEHQNMKLWEGETLPLWEGLQIIRLGGHFAGGSVLHWADGANGKGSILGSDILGVVADRRSVTIMRSYPNYIPLSASKAQSFSKTMEQVEFDRIYGGFTGADLVGDAKSCVKQSLDRYAMWVQNDDLDL